MAARIDDIRQSLAPCHAPVAWRLFEYGISISLQHNYLYCENPKVACSTIKKTLIHAELGRRVHYTRPDQIHFRELSPLLNPLQVGDFRAFVEGTDGTRPPFRFCFVRNPYARLLSAYLDKIVPGDPRLVYLAGLMGRSLGEGETLSFEEFALAVCEHPTEVMDPHWVPQTEITFQHAIPYDFIGRFERFDADFRTACHRAGVSFDRHFLKEESNATFACRRAADFYTPELRQKVYGRYRDDFEAFGYARALAA